VLLGATDLLSLVQVVYGMANFAGHNRPRFDELRFLYHFVVVPNTIFSETIIASVVDNVNIKKIAVAATSRHHRAAWSRPRRAPVQPSGTSEHGRLICRIGYI
jgi:hypothetical protein